MNLTPRSLYVGNVLTPSTMMGKRPHFTIRKQVTIITTIRTRVRLGFRPMTAVRTQDGAPGSSAAVPIHHTRSNLSHPISFARLHRRHKHRVNSGDPTHSRFPNLPSTSGGT